MAGVEVGDLGPKYGYNSKDNGWMILNQVRIPRNQMMMRFSEVDRQGNYNSLGDPRILYSIMLTIRVLMICHAPRALAHGLTIAGRYAVVRR